MSATEEDVIASKDREIERLVIMLKEKDKQVMSLQRKLHSVMTEAHSQKLDSSNSVQHETGNTKGRQFAKPFQQLVSHIKSRTQKTARQAQVAQTTKILSEDELKHLFNRVD